LPRVLQAVMIYYIIRLYIYIYNILYITAEIRPLPAEICVRCENGFIYKKSRIQALIRDFLIRVLPCFIYIYIYKRMLVCLSLFIGTFQTDNLIAIKFVK